MIKIRFDIKFDRTEIENLKVGEFVHGFEIIDITDSFIVAKKRNSVKTFSKRSGKCISDNSNISLFGNIPEDINTEMTLSTLKKDEYNKFIEELRKLFKIIRSGNLTENIILINTLLSDPAYDVGKVYTSNANIRVYKSVGGNIELWEMP